MILQEFDLTHPDVAARQVHEALGAPLRSVGFADLIVLTSVVDIIAKHISIGEMTTLYNALSARQNLLRYGQKEVMFTPDSLDSFITGQGNVWDALRNQWDRDRAVEALETLSHYVWEAREAMKQPAADTARDHLMVLCRRIEQTLESHHDDLAIVQAAAGVISAVPEYQPQWFNLKTLRHALAA